MKIVYLIAGTYNSGGMERVLANKSNYLVAQGHDIIIVTTDQRGRNSFFPLDKRIACYDLGINYEENNGKSFFNKAIHYPFKQWKHKKRLAELLRSLHADVVVSMFCNDVSILPRMKDGSKKVLEVHFSRFKRLQYGRKGLWRLADEWRNANDKQMVSRFDRFVVLTEEDEAYWGNIPNMMVIPNARTYAFERPAALNSKVVMAVGRYDYQKGFERLIDAWAKVCSKVNGWKLEIIGDGSLRQNMMRQIEENGLGNNIILKKLSADQMKDAYLNASVFALSSRYEGLPMVLLEAQAAGLPIVSFDCKCGPRDVVTDGIDGFLVEEGDIDALADALLRVMQDDVLRLRMGKSAYEQSDRYEESVVMKKWTDLFAGMMK
ncbi:MAG: glycosyltransferase family 4 protein [Prevotellaceae bacterium]|nr:glycosyltransferase family 4 protein [Prevotellaceae bacterium]